MRSPLVFLYVTKIRNGIVDFVRKPVRLICTVVMLAILVVGFFLAGSVNEATPSKTYRDARELYFIVAGLYLLLAGMIIRTGFKTGTTFFSMPDVNFLFPSPLSERGVMLYGMVRSIGSYLMSAVFIFYNYVSVRNIYNVGLEVMAPVTIGYVVIAIGAQIAAMRIYVVRNGGGTSMGFYESVLESVEKTHSAITAAKEGTSVEIIPRNVRLGKTGLGKGWGASAFYYKHRIENRRSRAFFIDVWGALAIIATLVFAFFMRNEDTAASGGAIAFGAYMQMFAVMLGRINRELSKPFIYLVPEPPFRKLLHCLRESVRTYLLDAVVVGVGLAIIFRESPVTGVLYIVVRLSFSMVFVAANCVLQRLWGSESNRVTTMMLYVAIVVVMLVPAIAVALVIGFGLLSAVAFLPIGQTVLFFIALCNVIVSVIAFYLAKDMLEYSELNNT